MRRDNRGAASGIKQVLKRGCIFRPWSCPWQLHKATSYSYISFNWWPGTCVWVVTTFDPQNNLLGVPAGSEGADSAGAIQSQGLQQPIQAAELTVDDLPANSTQRHELQHLCLFCLKSPSISFYFNSKIFFTRKIHSKTLKIKKYSSWKVALKTWIITLIHKSWNNVASMILSPITNEPVHLWNVPNRSCLRFPQLYLFTSLLLSSLWNVLLLKH